MPHPSPSKGWASLQAQALAEVRHFSLIHLQHVKEVAVTDLTGACKMEKRSEPLANKMVEEATNVTASCCAAEAAAEAEAKEMAMRKAMAKIKLRTALDDGIHRVADGLYIAGVGGSKNRKALEEHGISHIVNSAAVVPCFFKDEKIVYKTVNVFDSSDADISSHFESVSKFISEANAEGRAVLVHCYAGQSRSATLIAAHLMMTAGMSLREALRALQDARPTVCPNLGFIKQLKLLEIELSKK